MSMKLSSPLSVPCVTESKSTEDTYVPFKVPALPPALELILERLLFSTPARANSVSCVSSLAPEPDGVNLLEEILNAGAHVIFK